MAEVMTLSWDLPSLTLAISLALLWLIFPKVLENNMLRNISTGLVKALLH
jgi:hypothetical protein